jgi:hypothetical protein
MKQTAARNAWTLALAGVLCLLFAFGAFADRGILTLLNAVVATGPSAKVVFTEQDEASAQLAFQFHATGSGAAKIEYSLDKANWITAYTFTGTDDIKLLPVCGGCVFRANATTASGGNTVSVLVTLSGSRRLLTK